MSTAWPRRPSPARRRPFVLATSPTTRPTARHEAFPRVVPPQCSCDGSAARMRRRSNAVERAAITPPTARSSGRRCSCTRSAATASRATCRSRASPRSAPAVSQTPRRELRGGESSFVTSTRFACAAFSARRIAIRVSLACSKNSRASCPSSAPEQAHGLRTLGGRPSRSEFRRSMTSSIARTASRFWDSRADVHPRT